MWLAVRATDPGDSLHQIAVRHRTLVLLLLCVPAIVPVGYFLVLLLFRGKVIGRHPSSAIVDRLKAGDTTGACALAEALLAKHPHDHLVRLNATAAFHSAGRIRGAGLPSPTTPLGSVARTACSLRPLGARFSVGLGSIAWGSTRAGTGPLSRPIFTHLPGGGVVMRSLMLAA